MGICQKTWCHLTKPFYLSTLLAELAFAELDGTLFCSDLQSYPVLADLT